MRELLAQYLYESGASEEYFHALRTQDRPILDPERALADAIIAALPDMMVPVVWDDYPFNGEPVISMAVTALGTYFICDDTDDFTGLYCEFISCKDATWYGTVRAATTVICDHVHTDDHTPIQAAAQAHHVAQTMAAFGITVEDKA